MAETKIRITVEGNSVTGGKDVSISDFVQIIDTVRKLLAYAASEVLGKKGYDCDFVVSDYTYNNLVRVEITPQSLHRDSGQLITNLLAEHNKSLLSDNEKDSKNLSNKYLDSVFKLGKKSGVCIKIDAVSAALKSPVPIMETGRLMADAIKKIEVNREKETICKTAIIGCLKQLNLHVADKYAYVYPQNSKWNKVKILFQGSYKNQMIDCVDKMVEVSGVGRYHPRSFCPYEIKMEQITRLADGPPDISQFMGKFPHITGGKSVDEYMRELREEKD